MSQLKRFCADVIDILILIFIIYLVNYDLNKSVFDNNTYFIYIIVIITGVVFLILKDSYFLPQSIGKKAMNYIVYDKDNQIVIDNKLLIKRNIVSVIFAPLTITSIILYNKSMGDIIYKTSVKEVSTKFLLTERKKEISKKDITLTKIISIIPLTLTLILYTFMQKLNYYSIEYMTIIIILIFLIFKGNEIYKKIKTKKAIVMTVIIGCGIHIIISATLEALFIKNENIEEALQYNYPNAKTIEKKEYKNWGYVFFEYENLLNIVHFNKNENKYEIIYPGVDEQNSYQDYSEYYMSFDNIRMIKDYKVTINYNKSKNKTIIIVTSRNNMIKNEVKDSLKSKFKKIEYKNQYIRYALIDSKLDEKYFITIDEKNYYPAKKSN